MAAKDPDDTRLAQAGEAAPSETHPVPAPRQDPPVPARRRPPLRPIALLPARRGPLARVATFAFDVAVLVVLAVAIAILALSGRDIDAPAWLTAQISRDLDRGLPGAALQIDRVSLRFDRISPPQIRFHGVALSRPAPDGADLDVLRVPMVEIGLRRRALLRGVVQPDALRLSQAAVVLQRDAEGRFDLGFGGAASFAAPADLSELLEQIEAVFAQPALAPIRVVEADRIRLLLEDARANRSWSVEDGRITLTKTPDELRIASAFRLPGAAPPTPGGNTILPGAEIVFTARRDSAQGTLAVRLDALPAADIAAQSPSLAWLAPLSAPVSGAIRAGLTPEGRIGEVSGKLEIGSGALQPRPDLAPVPFESARAYFTFDPDAARLEFDDLRVHGPTLSLAGVGHAYLQTDPQAPLGLPLGMVAQIQSRDVRLNPEGLFASAARFSTAAADMRIGFQPFSVEIGQLSVQQDPPDIEEDGDPASLPLRITASGEVAAEQDGWRIGLDAEVPRVGVGRVLELWPVALAPRSRDWVVQNVAEGTLLSVRSAFRIMPGEGLRQRTSWQFSETQLTPLRGFPAITGASGFASLSQEGFALTLESGAIAAPGRRQIDLAGSTFRIPEPGARPALAELSLAADGPLPDVLALLDLAPLRLLRGVPGGPARIAQEGHATLRGRLGWPLRPGITLADMDMALEADLTQVKSETLAPGRVLSADALVLRADSERLTISGQADLSGLPLEAVWTRALGAAAAGSGSTLEGSIPLDVASLQALGLRPRDGVVRGQGRADVVVRFPGDDGAAVDFSLVSDLNRVALSLPGIGWSKPAAATGLLRVSGSLTPQLSVPDILFEAPGLQAQGAVRLLPDGTFSALDLGRLRIGDWLDAAARLEGRGAGRAPAVTLRGGRLDVAGLSRAGVGGAGAGGGGGAPVRLEGMRLAVSERIALTGLTGSFQPGRGALSGAFTARVNDAAAVRGQLAPGARGTGTALRITAADAGAALRAAGLFDRAQGGELSLVLQPGGRAGGYDGTLSVGNIRVTSASGLATLLNAISIVGLLDQLSGPGILFTAIDATFRLTPRYLEVRQGSGVGPSLGITMQGVYDLTGDRLNMQGVVSPVYVLNGIGQIFSRRGEGVFGFNYTMSGSARAPQVSVNPLSVLTPGLFRELFRRAPPTITE